MRVLVDGYNAIGGIGSLRRHFPGDLERARKELNDLLRRFKKARGHRITVVYDGPGGMWGREESHKTAGIREIFTAGGEQADDVIMRMARKDSSGLIVVTADGSVSSACRKAGAAVISPEEFEDNLMQAVLFVDKGVEEEPENHLQKDSKKKGPSRRLPKKKRKELRTKKKL